MDENQLLNEAVIGSSSSTSTGLNSEPVDLGGVREVPMYSGLLLAGLHQLRLHEDLCDVVLKVDSCKINAHRVVLASCSPYFKAMFTGSLCEREKEEIELKSVDELALSSLVEFAYTGKIRITHANVQALLHAANLLQLRCVEKLCCDFLQSQLHATNCIGISRFADAHACNDLHIATQKFIAHHFEELSDSEEFCLMENNELATLLSKDDLIVSSEESVFDALHSWVNYDPNKRRCFMGKLLQCIRLPLMTLKNLTRLYESNPFIQQNPSCQEQVNKALRYHLRPEERMLVASEMGHRAKIRGEAKMLCAVGGKNGLFATLNSVEVYYLATDTWTTVAPLSSRSQECTAAVVNQNLYIIGGIKCQLTNGSCYRRHDNNADRWSPETNKWQSVAGMHKCRSNHGVAVLSGKIWVLGGYNGESYLRSVECYCPKTNMWKMVAPMLKSRSIFNAAVVDGKLYAIGGYGPNYLNSVERYDPETNSWEMVSPMADKRINFGVGVLNGFIYVVGGHNGAMHLSSVEKYDPQQDKWTSVMPMDMARTGLGVATMDGVLYAAGGHSGATYLDRVERYDQYEDKWTVIKPMLNSSFPVQAEQIATLTKDLLCMEKDDSLPVDFN